MDYRYECPVCSRKTTTSAGMCAHICTVHDLDWGHANWMKAHGIDRRKVCKSGKGCRRPLGELVERECLLEVSARAP